WAGAAPSCSAGRPRWPRPTPSWPARGWAGRGWSTTAACAAPTPTSARAPLAGRALEGAQAAAIGDSPADLQLASVVGAMFLVANGAWAAELGDPATPVIVTPSPAGQGWAEAVAALLARRA